jgi:hypothetical protein
LLCVEGKLIGALLTFFERPQHCQKCCLSGTILYLPWDEKKTKINAHELEALRFLLTCYELTENTQLSAQGRGGRAEQGAGQGAAAGCVPAPTRPASINSWQFGGPTSAADMSIFDERR